MSEDYLLQVIPKKLKTKGKQISKFTWSYIELEGITEVCRYTKIHKKGISSIVLLASL